MFMFGFIKKYMIFFFFDMSTQEEGGRFPCVDMSKKKKKKGKREIQNSNIRFIRRGPSRLNYLLKT
jgi:hypothetical protein